MHASEAEILLYLEDKLNAESIERMKNHFSECARCREQLVILLRLPLVLDSVEVPGIDDRVLAKAREIKIPQRPILLNVVRSPYGRLVLAVVVVAVTGVSYFLLEQPLEPSRFRDRTAVPHVFSVHPPEGGTVQDPSPRFSWSPVKRSVGYVVTVYHENGTILWQGTSTDTLSILPVDVVLERGKTYLWKIESFLPDGSTYESRLNAFRSSP
ncbi:MAG: hypothetical protein WEB33_09735 [Bacteroidota bacterium]